MNRKDFLIITLLACLGGNCLLPAMQQNTALAKKISESYTLLQKSIKDEDNIEKISGLVTYIGLDALFVYLTCGLVKSNNALPIYLSLPVLQTFVGTNSYENLFKQNNLITQNNKIVNEIAPITNSEKCTIFLNFMGNALFAIAKTFPHDLLANEKESFKLLGLVKTYEKLLNPTLSKNTSIPPIPQICHNLNSEKSKKLEELKRKQFTINGILTDFCNLEKTMPEFVNKMNNFLDIDGEGPALLHYYSAVLSEGIEYLKEKKFSDNNVKRMEKIRNFINLVTAIGTHKSSIIFDKIVVSIFATINSIVHKKTLNSFENINKTAASLKNRYIEKTLKSVIKELSTLTISKNWIDYEQLLEMGFPFELICTGSPILDDSNNSSKELPAKKSLIQKIFIWYLSLQPTLGKIDEQQFSAELKKLSKDEQNTVKNIFKTLNELPQKIDQNIKKLEKNSINKTIEDLNLTKKSRKKDNKPLITKKIASPDEEIQKVDGEDEIIKSPVKDDKFIISTIKKNDIYSELEAKYIELPNFICILKKIEHKNCLIILPITKRDNKISINIYSLGKAKSAKGCYIKNDVDHKIGRFVLEYAGPVKNRVNMLFNIWSDGGQTNKKSEPYTHLETAAYVLLDDEKKQQTKKYFEELKRLKDNNFDANEKISEIKNDSATITGNISGIIRKSKYGQVLFHACFQH